MHLLFLHVKAMKGVVLGRVDAVAQWCPLRSIFLLHQHLPQDGKLCEYFKHTNKMWVLV